MKCRETVFSIPYESGMTSTNLKQWTCLWGQGLCSDKFTFERHIEGLAATKIERWCRKEVVFVNCVIGCKNAVVVFNVTNSQSLHYLKHRPFTRQPVEAINRLSYVLQLLWALNGSF